jgi:hypothetical protein
MRQGEGEYSDGPIAWETLRLVVVHSRHRAYQQTQTSASGPGTAAGVGAEPVKRGQAQWLAWLPDAAAALTAYAGRGPGHRGRRPPPWRYHTGHSRIVAESRSARRTRRGRPAKTEPPPLESGSRLGVAVDALPNPGEANGWAVLATTVSPETGTDAEILQAYQEQHTTVDPGFRWTRRPSAPCGWRSPNGLPPGPC